MTARRRQNRDERRKRILDSARALFGAESFDDISMADIAARAGVARATVFNHFPSKRSLVEAITGEVVIYWTGMLGEALADKITPTAMLIETLFQHMGAGIEQYYVFFRGVFREIARVQLGVDGGSEVARASAVGRERLTALLARGQDRGEIRTDIDAPNLAAAFDCLSNGTITQWLFDDPSDSLEARMQRVAAIFLSGAATGETDAPADGDGKVRNGAMGAPDWQPSVRLPASLARLPAAMKA